MDKIILTGFEPFGPYEFNPVQDSTKFFDGKIIGNYEVKGIVLPCTYYGAFDILKQAIDEINPVAIISTGLAATSAKGIRFETTARNYMAGKYPDANGESPKGLPIIKEGIEFMKMNSDNEMLANAVYKQGIPTEMSANAGDFICNSLAYLTNNHIQSNNLGIKNVFIHVPFTKKYESKVDIGKDKTFLPEKDLHLAIETIIKNI